MGRNYALIMLDIILSGLFFIFYRISENKLFLLIFFFILIHVFKIIIVVLSEKWYTYIMLYVTVTKFEIGIYGGRLRWAYVK